ncbi:MAG: helix-turn-helix domain-containing protein [Gammaproteobacteria bacterium]
MDVPIYTPQQLSDAMRAYRKRLGLTQSAAGATVGVRPKTVSALESKASGTTVGTLFKLLSALELELVLRPKPVQKPPTHDSQW